MAKLRGVTANEFDQCYPIGSAFNYYPLLRADRYEVVESRSPAWALGHDAVVVSVTGRTGGVSVEHLEPISIGCGPAVVLRTPDGFWGHPATPECDESTPYSEYMDWFVKRGLEVKGHYMDGDSDELTERWEAGDVSAVAEWQPVPPEGDGWYLWSIFDTEDGPYCEFVRQTPAKETDTDF